MPFFTSLLLLIRRATGNPPLIRLPQGRSKEGQRHHHFPSISSSQVPSLRPLWPCRRGTAASRWPHRHLRPRLYSPTRSRSIVKNAGGTGDTAVEVSGSDFKMAGLDAPVEKATMVSLAGIGDGMKRSTSTLRQRRGSGNAGWKSSRKGKCLSRQSVFRMECAPNTTPQPSNIEFQGRNGTLIE